MCCGVSFMGYKDLRKGALLVEEVNLENFADTLSPYIDGGIYWVEFDHSRASSDKVLDVDGTTSFALAEYKDGFYAIIDDVYYSGTFDPRLARVKDGSVDYRNTLPVPLGVLPFKIYEAVAN